MVPVPFLARQSFGLLWRGTWASAVPCLEDRRGDYAILAEAGLDRLGEAYPTLLAGVHKFFLEHFAESQPRLPGVARFARRPVGGAHPRIDGLAGAGYSLITDCELGVLKVLPTHLAFDAAKGVFMASSPWLFGFAKNGTRYWMPHVLMGTADVLAAITSKTD